jgi:putative exporter of polyketide antibiotics
MHAAESRWLLQAGNPTAQRATATAAEQQTFATGQKWITSVPILSGDVMPELNTYLDDDAQLTNSLLNGGTSDARLLAAVGYDTGPSDAAYAKFDAGLTQIIGVDQQAFAAATVKGENGLVTWLWLPWLWMLATIALIVFGFAPRLREYR